MPGWRRSADRTRLRLNSLLTGNFTGNFHVLADFNQFLSPEVAVPQGLLDKFPMPVNRELFEKNRESKSVNRELFSDNVRQRRLPAFNTSHDQALREQRPD
jgi:hypothetical protein